MSQTSFNHTATVGAVAVARALQLAPLRGVLVLAARLAASAAVRAENAVAEWRAALVVREALGAARHAVVREAGALLVGRAAAKRHPGLEVRQEYAAVEAAVVAAAL